MDARPARPHAPRSFAGALLLVLLGAPWNACALEQSTESTRHTSPLGKYNYLGAANTLTVGVEATGAGAPTDAGQGTLQVNGDLTVNTGDIVLDESLNVDTNVFRTYPSSSWGGTHWFGINVDPGTLIGPSGQPRVEMEVNGDIFAKRFFAAPIDNHSDELLYFGPSSDGLWMEMGSKAGYREIWSVDGGYSAADSAARFTAHPAIVLNYYSTDPDDPQAGGNVGIGTTVSPTYKLQVGDAGSTLEAVAHNWQAFSSRDYKKDITPLSAAQARDLAGRIRDLRPVYFRYKEAPSSQRAQVGVLAEEAPKEVLTPDRSTLSLTDSIAFLSAVLREMSVRQSKLEAEVARLESEVALLEGRKKGLR